MTQLRGSARQSQSGASSKDDGALAPGELSPGASAPVSIRDVSKTFKREGGSIVKALDGVSIDVRGEEILVLLGPSGCGKTTLLRCIAGLEEPSHGEIDISGTPVFNSKRKLAVPPNKRDVNMMFQSYALWPHMTLEANVAFPLRIGGMSRSGANAKANEYLTLVGLEGLGKQYAGNISGGQQQRVALARTLVSEPAVVLFDEPLSNVDAKVRAQLRSEILRLHSELEFAAVYVTHDQTEAMALGDRLAVMDQGQVAQIASPVEVYDAPSTAYVAQFIGAANMFEAQFVDLVSGSSTRAKFRTDFGDLEVAMSGEEDIARIHGSTELHLMIRPEACLFTDAPRSESSPNTWHGTINTAVFAGSQTEYECLVGDRSISVWRTGTYPLAAGTEVHVSFPPESIRVIAS